MDNNSSADCRSFSLRMPKQDSNLNNKRCGGGPSPSPTSAVPVGVVESKQYPCISIAPCSNDNVLLTAFYHNKARKYKDLFQDSTSNYYFWKFPDLARKAKTNYWECYLDLGN